MNEQRHPHTPGLAAVTSSTTNGTAKSAVPLSAAGRNPEDIDMAKTDNPVTAEGAVIDPSVTSKAKELFAALLTKADEETKAIARELGTVLGLHSAASSKADTTGDYKAGDLSK